MIRAFRSLLPSDVCWVAKWKRYSRSDPAVHRWNYIKVDAKRADEAIQTIIVSDLHAVIADFRIRYRFSEARNCQHRASQNYVPACPTVTRPASAVLLTKKAKVSTNRSGLILGSLILSGFLTGNLSYRLPKRKLENKPGFA